MTKWAVTELTWFCHNGLYSATQYRLHSVENTLEIAKLTKNKSRDVEEVIGVPQDAMTVNCCCFLVAFTTRKLYKPVSLTF